MSSQNIIHVDIHTDERSVTDPDQVANTGVAIHLGSLSPVQLELLSMFMAANQAAVIGLLAYPEHDDETGPQEEPDPTPPPPAPPEPQP